jgi:hypothetical protein
MYDAYDQFYDWLVENDRVLPNYKEEEDRPMYRKIMSVQDSQLYEEINGENATTGLLKSQLMNIHLYISYFEHESERCPHRTGKYTCVKDGELNIGICSWSICPLAEGKDGNNG